MNVRADLTLCWLHRSDSRFYRAPANLILQEANVYNICYNRLTEVQSARVYSEIRKIFVVPINDYVWGTGNQPKYVHVAARNFYSCSIWTEQYALCFITNTKSTCVSAEFTNQFDCYFMSIHMKFLSFFRSFFLSFFLFFFTFIKCVTPPSIHRWCNICCLFPGDDSNKH